MKRRGPIRYRNLDIEEKPTRTRLANIRAVAQMLADPHCAAHVDGEPRWFVVRCQSGQERLVLAELSGRQFWVYLPERRTNVCLYPSYLFVWSRNIEHDHRHIVDCPGVLEIMQYTSGVQATLSFDTIDIIRAGENKERCVDPDPVPVDCNARRSRRKPRRSKKLKRTMARLTSNSEHEYVPNPLGAVG
jgi:hypothetical protein